MNISTKIQAADAAVEIAAMPLEQLNPARVSRFYDDTIWPVFERLRREDPIHFTPESEYGPYWSITKWNDIMAVDTNHEAFSSAEGITLINQVAMAEQEKVMGARRRGGAGFITMDEPDHSLARKAVSPTLAPSNLHAMAPQVRERAGQILDSLPIGEEFDWVDLVSKELTAMTLATLFDFPFEQRRKLTWWSDMITNQPGHGPVESWEQKGAAMVECFNAFQELWNERVNAEPRGDLISMLAHNPATRDMPLATYQGNVVLLIVGGNDTTRNTMSGLAYGLDKFPEQRAKLEADPSLIPNAVSEIIRWQTPLAHMRRTALEDTELFGHKIAKGDKIILWYLSANRDESVFDDGDALKLDRDNARRHLSFGYGVHRCVGARLAELQLRILLEEMAARRMRVNVVGIPERVHACFVHGFRTIPVQIEKY